MSSTWQNKCPSIFSSLCVHIFNAIGLILYILIIGMLFPTFHTLEMVTEKLFPIKALCSEQYLNFVWGNCKRPKKYLRSTFGDFSI